MVMRSIKNRITIAVSAYLLIVLFVLGALGYWWVFLLMRDTVGDERARQAGILSHTINDFIEHRIDTLRGYVSDEVWLTAAAERNAVYASLEPQEIQRRFADLEQRWMREPLDEGLREEYLENQTARELSEVVASDPNIAEFFITDERGGLVASSKKTSDFYQADEEWWQRAYNEGSGEFFMGEVEYDQSADVLSIAFALPLRKDARVVGVAKAVINFELFIRALKKFSIGKTGHISLIDAHGIALYHENMTPLSGRIFDQKSFERLESSIKRWAVMRVAGVHRDPVFVAWERVKNPLLSKGRNAWFVLITQDPREVFRPLISLVIQSQLLFLLLLILIIPFGLKLGGKITLPLRRLTEATRRIAAGELDVPIEVKTGDEIEELAGSFSSLLQQWRHSTVSRDYLDNIVESMNEGLIVIDPLGMVKTVNRAVCALSGKSSSELLGSDVRRLFPEAQRGGLSILLKKFLEGRQVREYETFLVKDKGEEIPVILSAGALRIRESLSARSHGASTEAVLLVRDVSARKSAELDLAQREAQFRELFENMSSCVAVYEAIDGGTDFVFKDLNRSAERIENIKKQDVIGRRVSECFPAIREFGVFAVFQRVWATGRPEYFPAKVYKDERISGWRENYVYRLPSGEVVAIYDDVTERERTQEQLRQALKDAIRAREIMVSMLEDNNQIREDQEKNLKELKDTQAMLVQSVKMASVGMLAGGVAHEINNPLTGILNNVQLIKMMAAQKADFSMEEFRELLDVIESSAERCTKIISSLLAFSRSSKGVLVDLSINDLIEKAICLVEHEMQLQNIAIEKELGQGLPCVHGEPQLLQQIVFDIIGNAKWAVQKNGGAQGCIRIRSYRPHEKTVAIAISDNGIGISPENIERIFEPFFTTKPVGEGTGLGLSIIYNIVKKHDGTIRVESEPGKATTFIIELPAVAA